MEEFARGMTDDRAGRSLARAIRGRGAFRRFKDKFNEEYPNLLPAWYAWLHQMQQALPNSVQEGRGRLAESLLNW